MLKSFIQWILPVVVLLLIALYLVLSPVLATHAAAPTTHSQAPASRIAAPDKLWQP